MPVKRNQERDAKILELRNSMTLTQIAEHLNLTTNVVGGVFFRADNPYKPRPARIRAVTDAALGKAARNAGLTLMDLRVMALGGKREARP